MEPRSRLRALQVHRVWTGDKMPEHPAGGARVPAAILFFTLSLPIPPGPIQTHVGERICSKIKIKQNKHQFWP